MTDYGDIVTRLAVDSDIIRVSPNALVQIFASGTSNLVWEGTADAYGQWSVPSLATGKYDIKVGGKTVRTIHHVTADHTHAPDRILQFFKAGSISGDQNESADMPVYFFPATGNIVSIDIIVQSIDASGDMTVHLLKGARDGATGLTMAANSVWQHRVNPGSAKNRHSFNDSNPGVSIAANECVTVGIDYAAGTISGLTVLAVFRES